MSGMPDFDTDVVVAGAGAAGLAAAIAAADRGARVVLLEAKETFRAGSNTSMSTAMIPAGGSRWQEAAGIDDSADLLFADTMAKTKGTADTAVARALADVSVELVHWMADDCGVPLELADVSFPGHTRIRHHTVADRSGRTLHGQLLEAAAARDQITLITPMRLVSLTEIEGGLHVTVELPTAEPDQITCRAVVLATNGFGANEKLVRKYIPEIAEGLYFGGDGSTGDALAIGEQLGAETAFMDAYQGHGSVATPHGVLLTWTTVMNGAIVVNTAGERFGDESTGYSEYAVPVLEQPGAVAWVVFDRAIHEKAIPFADYQDLLAIDGVRWVGSVAELAALIEADAAVLGATLDQAASAARGSMPDPFGRTLWPHVLEPPFAAVKTTGALFHTQGGLRINASAAVLRNGEPIPRVFAAGGAAAGISGHGAAGYMSGNGLLSALGLGYVAAGAIELD
jgi:fumarate reductase flavoprotein subunit